MPPKAPSSKRGKENAPPKAKAAKVVHDIEADFDGEISCCLELTAALMDDEPVKPAKKVGRPPKGGKKEKPPAEMEPAGAVDIEEEVPTRASRDVEAAPSKSSRDSDELQRVSQRSAFVSGHR